MIPGDPRPEIETRRAWTARSLGSAFQHHVFYALIRFGGRWAAYLLLVFVVAWYVLFRPSARRRASFYLRRRFPGRNPFQRLLDSYRLCLGLGEVLVDRAVLGILGPHKLNCSIEGREKLRALLAEGHGLILLTAHVGSWQLGMASLSRLDAPVSLLIHREEGDVDRHFFEHRRGAPPVDADACSGSGPDQAWGSKRGHLDQREQAVPPFRCRFIDPAGYLGGTLEMLQVLKAAEVLCIMGDRVMGGDGSNVSVDFLGGAISVPFSPYKLASATAAPIAVIFPYKSGHDSYALHVARVIRVPENLGRLPSAFLPFAQQYIQALEEFVQAHPFQFFNFFDMWSPEPWTPKPN